jgi:hypothetical protein
MLLGLIKRLLLAAAVAALLWWLLFGLTDAQIDSFQKRRAQLFGALKDVKRTVIK